jgi:hypothetical protein
MSGRPPTQASNENILRFKVAFPDRGGKPIYLVATDSLF